MTNNNNNNGGTITNNNNNRCGRVLVESHWVPHSLRYF